MKKTVKRTAAVLLASLLVFSGYGSVSVAAEDEPVPEETETTEVQQESEPSSEVTEAAENETAEEEKAEEETETTEEQKETEPSSEVTEPAENETAEEVKKEETTEEKAETTTEQKEEAEAAKPEEAAKETTEQPEPETASAERAYVELKTASGDVYDTEFSKEKTAENLKKEADGSYVTDITLSLPAAEKRLESDVVFALDKSTYSDFQETVDNAIKLLDELKESGAKIKVSVVIFNRTGHPSDWYDLDTQYDDIVKLFETKYSGGSNMHAGMLAAKEMLEKDTEVSDERKYLVLVSDGSTYLSCLNDDYTVPYSRSYVPVEKGKGTSWGGYWVEGYWNPYVKGSDEAGNVRRPKTDDESAWISYLEDVKARNEESDGDQYDFVWEYYDKWEKGAAGIDVIKETYKETPRTFRTCSNTDISYLRCYETWQDLQKYHTYTICVKDNGTTSQDAAIGFMRFLNGGNTPDFENIKNEILYYLSAGSSVEDYMGYTDDYDFDLTSLDDMVLSVENSKTKETTEYKGEKISDTRYGFCPIENGGYRFEIEYTAGDKKEEEHFTWYINDSITNFERVSLKYREKLTNPKTDEGTYGTYDKDGSKKYADLYTNRKAVLHPVNSAGEKLEDEEFGMPTVSYTVEPDQLRYEANGGTGTMPVKKGKTGEAVKVDANAFTRDGYEFTGWNTKADGSGKSYTAGSDYVLTEEDDVLYAQWKKKPVPDDDKKKDDTPKKDNNQKKTDKKKKSPSTFDPSNSGLWNTLTFGSLFIAVLAYVVRRKYGKLF